MQLYFEEQVISGQCLQLDASGLANSALCAADCRRVSEATYRATAGAQRHGVTWLPWTLLLGSNQRISRRPEDNWSLHSCSGRSLCNVTVLEQQCGAAATSSGHSPHLDLLWGCVQVDWAGVVLGVDLDLLLLFDGNARFHQ